MHSFFYRIFITLTMLVMGLIIRVDPEHVVLSCVAWITFIYPIVDLYFDWRSPYKWGPFVLYMGICVCYNVWFHLEVLSLI